jgi:hypothetical protein
MAWTAAGDFGPNLIGIGVVKLVEDGQSVLPRHAGGVGVVGGVVGVAEVSAGGGFVYRSIA